MIVTQEIEREPIIGLRYQAASASISMMPEPPRFGIPSLKLLTVDKGHA